MLLINSRVPLYSSCLYFHHTGLSKQHKKHRPFWFPSLWAFHEKSWKYKQQFNIYQLKKKSHIFETQPKMKTSLGKEGAESISAFFPHPCLGVKMFTWTPLLPLPVSPQPDCSHHGKNYSLSTTPKNEAFQIHSVKRSQSFGTHYHLFFQCLLPSSDLKCFFWVL